MVKSYVRKDLIPLIDDLLTRDRPITNTNPGTVMFDWLVQINTDQSARVQICNGKPMYVQVIFFEGNAAVHKLGPFYTFFNNYKFKHFGKTVSVNVAPEE